MRILHPPVEGEGRERSERGGVNAKASPIDRFRRRTAQRLRARTTEAEKKLWRLLRDFPIRGTHFRRQVPIGRYVADFACLTSRLVIELDGSQHAQSEITARDQVRTDWL
jgi:very-short-patch-repair endonuclease